MWHILLYGRNTEERAACSHWLPPLPYGAEEFLPSVLRDGFLNAVPHPRTGCFSRSVKHLQFSGGAADQSAAYAGAEMML